MPAAADSQRKTQDSAVRALAAARRRSPDAFICQAGLIVESPRKCEHCGACDDDVCRRLPTVMQEKIDSLTAALSDFVRLGENAPRDKDNDTAFVDVRDLESALSRSRAALTKSSGG